LSLKICGEKQNLRQVLQRKPFWRSQKAPQKNSIKRWDSERELSSRWHRARTTKYNRLILKFSHRSTRLCIGTQVYRIQWNNAIWRPLYAVQGNSRSPIILPMEHSYTTRFQVMADYWSNFR